tara:strand:- start:320 stop:712 length:393 start_codon:yes stop_codon:yes gene_type:complete
MKGTKIRQYRKDNGNLVHVYAVSGTAEELDTYSDLQGDNLVMEGETPLWFTVQFAGQECELIASSKGNIIANNQTIDEAVSIAEQYAGTPLGDAVASKLAEQLVGGLFASKPSSTPATKATESAEDLGSM